MTDSQKIKIDWMNLPVDYFKPLTFGELQVGDQFITLPSPGDNEGHGGLRQSYNLFTKTEMEIKEAAPGLPYGIPHGEAVDDRGVKSGQPHSMFVIKVNTREKKLQEEIAGLRQTIEAMREQEANMAALFRGARPTDEGRIAHARRTGGR